MAGCLVGPMAGMTVANSVSTRVTYLDAEMADKNVAGMAGCLVDPMAGMTVVNSVSSRVAY